MVNHSREFVSLSSEGKTTTKTLEGVHGVIKVKARRLNLFSGQPSKEASLKRKIAELVYRFNHRETLYAEDGFLLFLHLLCVYYPCCSDDDVSCRLSKISMW